MALSAWPLVCGYPGLGIMCVKQPQSHAEVKNLLLVNCGPLSDITLAWKPNCLNMDFVTAIMAWLVLSERMAISGYLSSNRLLGYIHDLCTETSLCPRLSIAGQGSHGRSWVTTAVCFCD